MAVKRIISILILGLLLQTIYAQKSIIKGYVFDAETGSPIPGVAVVIEGTYLGAATSANGFYVISRVPAGNHVLIARNVAYNTVKKTIVLKMDETLQQIFKLKQNTLKIGLATVTARKEIWKTNNPSSMHKLTSETIKRIPGIAGEADLAEYLQVLPGVISSGDRGGQLYIRGGSPVQNLTLLDGMTVISPFHSLGFISVFDTDIIKTADVYTSGFGARYGGRISSVIDIKTRDGNRTKFGGKASLSTFGYSFLFEGPIKEMKEESPSSSSFLISQKRSYIDATAAKMIPYLDSIGIPFMYNDIYGKISFRNKDGDQLDIYGMYFSDRARYNNIMESNWHNAALNVKYIYSPPKLSSLWETSVSISDYRGTLTENGKYPRNTKYNGADTRLLNHHYSTHYDWSAGYGMNFFSTSHEYLNIDSIKVSDDYYTADLDFFYQAKLKLDPWLLEPGFQLRLFTNYMHFSPEPRLKIKYSITEDWSINFASGLYAQELLSTTSEEDVLKIFQGFNIGVANIQSTFRGKKMKIPIMKAFHLSGGVSWIPNSALRISVDTYFKNFYKLINYNRNKIYLDDQYHQHIIEYYRSQYIYETGKAYGAELLVDWKKDPFSIWLAYSLSWVTRTDEFYTFPPHYDRRHNLNFVAGYQFGPRNSFDLKIRWNIGSGLPVTQSLGIYENLQFQNGSLLQDLTGNGTVGIWYGPLHQGRLPWYHRLDISLHKKWRFSPTHSFETSIGIINAYNRANVFYFDRYSFERIDQYPILPSFSVSYRF